MRFELGYEVGEHTAGDFVVECVRIRCEHLGIERAVFEVSVADRLEIVVDLFERCVVESRLVTELFESKVDCFGCGLARAAAETRSCGVDYVNARFDSLHIRHIRHTRRAVSVQNYGDFDFVLDCTDKLVRLKRSHRARHILYADGVYAHIFKLFCHLCKSVESMNGALRIADCARYHSPAFESGFGCRFEVAKIVECVEDTDNIDAVVNGFFHKHLDDFVGIVLVTQEVLTSQKHLEFGIRHCLAQVAQTLPRIFVEISQTYVKHRTAPALYGIISRLVHRGENVGKF